MEKEVVILLTVFLVSINGIFTREYANCAIINSVRNFTISWNIDYTGKFIQLGIAVINVNMYKNFKTF